MVEDRYLLARQFCSGADSSVRRHFETVTDRRMAATALAIRLYQLDHAGARPQRLDELVPSYLPAVPLDAMAAGNRRISYLPTGADPVLYSVGRNGDDDAGSEAPIPQRYGELDAWERLDRAFYLTALPRELLRLKYPGQPEPATTEAESDDYGPPWERKAKAPTTQMAGFAPR
jgi:hypothetical protein